MFKNAPYSMLTSLMAGCCYSYTGMVSPTSAEIGQFEPEMQAKIYSNFLKMTLQILEKHSGKMLRSYGDEIFYYFPKTKNLTDVDTITDVLECCLEQMENQKRLSNQMSNEQLPEISYKVCADYRPSFQNDSFEIPQSEILYAQSSVRGLWLKSPTNCVILGDDLNKVRINFPELDQRYDFKNMPEYIIDGKKRIAYYAIYILSRKLSPSF